MLSTGFNASLCSIEKFEGQSGIIPQIRDSASNPSTELPDASTRTHTDDDLGESR